MRSRSLRKRLLSLLLAASVGSGMLVSVPGAEAAEADCGANDGNKCWENQSCINVLFYKQCTTKYKYYPGGSSSS